MTENGTLSPKQQALLTALVGGERIEAAARAAKVSPRTAYRWQKLDAFQCEYERAKANAFEQKLKLLKDGIGTALATLLRNMDKNVAPNIQVRAAQVWIDNAVKIYHDERIEDLAHEVQELLAGGGKHAQL